MCRVHVHSVAVAVANRVAACPAVSSAEQFVCVKPHIYTPNEYRYIHTRERTNEHECIAEFAKGFAKGFAFDPKLRHIRIIWTSRCVACVYRNILSLLLTVKTDIKCFSISLIYVKAFFILILIRFHFIMFNIYFCNI